MTQPANRNALPESRSMQWQWWQRIAQRIRVPLGFLGAAIYLVAVELRAPRPAAIAWSLALVLPGLALRAAASGTVKKNRELTVTGPYAFTRNPLYLGSALTAGGFALALLSWPVALLLAAGFAVIYVPVMASEERFLRSTFPAFDAYCRSVPRFFPRVTPARFQAAGSASPVSQSVTEVPARGFCLALYLKHREYNAAIGAVLLYLSLLFLHPAVENVLRRTR